MNEESRDLDDLAKMEAGQLPLVTEHPERGLLADEVHARPPMRLDAPAKVSHLVMLSGEDAAPDERSHLALLCERFDVSVPDHAARQFSADFGAFKLRWERHTEFAAWTFVRESAMAAATFDQPFADLPLGHVPAEWLATLPGHALVAINISLMPRELSSPTADLIEELFTDPVGGPVADGAASIWTDFRRHGGRNRILIHDVSLTRGRRGRLLQRLIEIESYRMFALLAFPLARAHGSQVSEIDRRLADLTARLRDADGVEVQRRLLDDALSLGAEIERIAAATNYRFSAARAYHELAEQRIDELRERPACDQELGMQPLGQFLRRRSRPAMRTCESLRDRLETASRHLARAANLLRSRIELDLAEQNRAQLAAMNRRSRLQLRLQRTIEGLSVAAISYYVVGLVGTILEAIPVRYLPVSVTVATGLSVPFVLLLAWILMRRIHRGFMDKLFHNFFMDT